MVRCPYCRKKISNDFLYCNYCGSNLTKVSKKPLIFFLVSVIILLRLYFKADSCEPSGEGLNCLGDSMLFPIGLYSLLPIGIVSLTMYIINFVSYKKYLAQKRKLQIK